MTDRAAPGPAGREIYTTNADGSDPLALTTNTVADTDPAYSPDGTRIAFARTNDIWVMNPDGGGQVAITGAEGPDSEPAWSPDGTQIVYVSNQGVPGGGVTGPELFVRNADGSGPVRRLTDTPNNAASGAPAWSPAGDQIAYESNADGSFEIYTIDATATASFGTRRSANAVGQNYQHPSWAPDATRIAFERGSGTNVGDNTKEIWTMSADGSDPVQLTNNNFYDVQPAYSPDGAQIAYETNEAGEREIYMRPSTPGPAAIPVTSTAAGAADEQPDWGWGGSTAPAADACGPRRPHARRRRERGARLRDGAASDVRGAAARTSGFSGRASQKGITFVPLTEARQVPVGSFLDTRHGKVRMESAANATGKRQRGDFLSGLFQVRQSKRRSAKGLTDLVLKGSSFRSCRAGRGKSARAALSRRRIRRLRANARGRFRTTGRNSSATVRGTKWSHGRSLRRHADGGKPRAGRRAGLPPQAQHHSPGGQALSREGARLEPGSRPVSK